MDYERITAARKRLRETVLHLAEIGCDPELDIVPALDALVGFERCFEAVEQNRQWHALMGSEHGAYRVLARCERELEKHIEATEA